MDWFGLALEDLDVYPQAGFQVILDFQILIIDAKYQRLVKIGYYRKF